MFHRADPTVFLFTPISKAGWMKEAMATATRRRGGGGWNSPRIWTLSCLHIDTSASLYQRKAICPLGARVFAVGVAGNTRTSAELSRTFNLQSLVTGMVARGTG